MLLRGGRPLGVADEACAGGIAGAGDEAWSSPPGRGAALFSSFATAKLSLNIQGRSLAALLRGDTLVHREHVISEYADNAEAMVRTDRWKLIYSAGNRRRRDGYAIDGPSPGPMTRLYDLTVDPHELINVARLPENQQVIERLLQLLAAHMKATTRDPGAVSDTDDPHAILERLLPPSDGARRRRSNT